LKRAGFEIFNGLQHLAVVIEKSVSAETPLTSWKSPLFIGSGLVRMAITTNLSANYSLVRPHYGAAHFKRSNPTPQPISHGTIQGPGIGKFPFLQAS